MSGQLRGMMTCLAYAGTLPFWLLALSPETVLGIDTASAFVAYGAIIGSFMAGTLWGNAQVWKASFAIIGASNFIAFLAFMTVVHGPSLLSLSIQLVLFGLLLVADLHLTDRKPDMHWYRKLRLHVTGTVAVSYAVMMLDAILAMPA